jgi:hypothetical protein
MLGDLAHRLEGASGAVKYSFDGAPQQIFDTAYRVGDADLLLK